LGALNDINYMTIKSLRQKYLKNLPPLEADSLLQLCCNKEKAFILTHTEYRLTLKQLVLFYYYFWQFKKGTPIAYIAGRKEFFGLNFFVNKHTLIPRPDTEIMVEEAIKILASLTGNTTLIDVGTGSGCIPISILKNLKQQPTETIAVDISPSALKMAKKNAEQHGVNIKFVQSNLLEKIMNYNLNTNIIITANLPYLTEEQFANEPSIQHEPESALVAGEHGLGLYRTLLEQIKTLNKPVTAFFEIDPSQREKIKSIITSILPSAEVEIKTDLAGRDRLVVLKI
jgi:release factor glutamine methyltransferase